jgi:aconitate hydratase
MAEVSFARVRIDLSELEPLTAAPSSPENIVPIAAVAGRPVAQVAIGSCTNSSYQDLMLVAEAMKGRTVHPNVELAIAPGSRQVLAMLAQNGALAELVRAGARILESACGPCIGLGFSPAEGAASLRTFNRNFAGRTGTTGDQVFLVSAETAVAAALTGAISDPRDLTEKLGIAYPRIEAPRHFEADDRFILPPVPAERAAEAHVIRGSTIEPPPRGEPLPESLRGPVLIKAGDKITTDHIMPAGSLLKYRSNVPQYARYVFNCFNEAGKPTFAERALEAKKRGDSGFIVAGDSYGQGSSREHAALCPMYLGVKAVLARTIERIHQANLVNFAILPLTFAEAKDGDRIECGDELVLPGVAEAVAAAETVTVRNVTKGCDIRCNLKLAPRQRKILAAGGLLNYTRQGGT